jgi:hypothetical protein
MLSPEPQTEKTIKRKPGRPRKKPLPVKSEIKGIVQEPKCPDNCVEMLYNMPDDIKKINTYANNLRAETINFSFRAEGIYMYMANKSFDNQCRIFIDGKKSVSYYCEVNHDIFVRRQNLDLVFQSLNKQTLSISFIVQKDEKNEKMYVVVKDAYKFLKKVKIDLVLEDIDENKVSDNMFDEKTEPDISLNLRGKFLQNLISGSKNFEKTILFRMIYATGDFEIIYRSKHDEVESIITPEKTPEMSKELNLIQHIGETEVFTVSVFRDTLKPISSANIAEFLRMQLWKDKNLWFKISVNNDAIIFDIRAKFVDYRNIR